MKSFLKSLVAGSVLFVSALQAASLSNPPTSIKIAQQQGIEILEHFETPNGLDGWLVKNRGGFNVWYSDEAGYVYVGAFLDPAGNNLTAQYLKEKAPKVRYDELLAKLTTVSTSKTPTEEPVYIFYEPHCGFCSAVHAAVHPYVQNGAEVRWIPVAFLKPQSQPNIPSSYELIASVLKSEDPLAVLDAHEASKAIGGGRGGLTQGVTPDQEVFKIAEVNSQVMKELGFSGTPAIVYTGSDGAHVLKKGFPNMNEFPEIFKMERQDSADGRLARFKSDPQNFPAN